MTNQRYFKKEVEGSGSARRKIDFKLRAANISPLQIKESEMSRSSFAKRGYYQPKKKTISLVKRNVDSFNF